MFATGPLPKSSRPTIGSMGWGVGISVAVHLLLFGGYLLAGKYDLWNKGWLPVWVKKATHTLAATPPPQLATQTVQKEAPLLFLDVNPKVETVEAPERAPYYSSRNSKAANPDAKRDLPNPNLDGTQAHVPKTETVPRASKAMPLQPAKPKNEPEQNVEAQAKPKGGTKRGDLAMAKPADKQNDGQAEDGKGDAEKDSHVRPRTLAQARIQQALAPGEKMKLDGGVRRQSLDSSFDSKATPFGAYDEAIVNAIRARWYDLLDKQQFARDRAGKVVLEFRLNYDGRVTDMKVVENNVDDLLCYVCQRAILDPAPYEAWPSEMRRLIGENYRDVKFTFYYN